MQQQNFRQIAELLPGGALLLDPDGVVLSAARAANSVWDSATQPLAGQKLHDLLATDHHELTTFLQACAGCEQVIAFSATLRHSGAPLKLQGRKVNDDETSLATQIVLIGEIDRPAVNDSSNVSDAIDVRDRLLAMLVHDFRNGLAAAPMGFDVLEMEFGKSETIQLLRRQIDRLSQLVDETLDLSRLLRGKIEWRPNPVVLQELAREAAKHVESTLQARNLQLNLELPAEPAWATLDPQRFVQALKILLLERTKNMSAGGVVSVSLAREADQWMLRVRDRAPAVDRALLPYVFDLISQLRFLGSQYRTQFEMGLSLVGGLIALQGGRIHAQALDQPPGMETILNLPARSAG